MIGTPHPAFSADHARVAHDIQAIAQRENVKLYLVGGVVRDLLRGISFHDRDLDLVVEGDAIRFSDHVLKVLGGTLKRFPDFYTSKLVNPTGAPSIEELDFASTRTEIYSTPGALPTVAIATIVDDLRRRDFTVNSMAVELSAFIAFVGGSSNQAKLSEVVLDPFAGRQDLVQKTIRVLHERSFLDDPTRLFRACRYQARLNGSLSADTKALFEGAMRGGALKTISRFRIASEMRKMVAEDSPAAVFRLALEYGLLEETGLVAAEKCGDLVRYVESAPDFGTTHDAVERLNLFLAQIVSLSGSPERGMEALLPFGLSKRKIREITAAVVGS